MTHAETNPHDRFVFTVRASKRATLTTNIKPPILGTGRYIYRLLFSSIHIRTDPLAFPAQALPGFLHAHLLPLYAIEIFQGRHRLESGTCKTEIILGSTRIVWERIMDAMPRSAARDSIENVARCEILAALIKKRYLLFFAWFHCSSGLCTVLAHSLSGNED